MLFVLKSVLFLVLEMVLLFGLVYIGVSDINFKDYITKKSNNPNEKKKILKDFKTGITIVIIILPILFFLFQSFIG
ncbi:hypothetical protein [Tepidibacter aestuarii]|uniref:hypothetical protein n=1 Tax=Tepidibacter aestuarii TaxID=2925782 RepID=UPI0020C02DDC|nr:hypothetical protein [Tepidibacter aestuarii]CAH2213544.1 protein of unknown function [Tepidibacter aestuarii]